MHILNLYIRHLYLHIMHLHLPHHLSFIYASFCLEWTFFRCHLEMPRLCYWLWEMIHLGSGVRRNYGGCLMSGVGWLWISIESWGRWCLAVKGVNSVSYSNVRWCDKSQLSNKFQWIRVCHIGSSWGVFGCDKIEIFFKIHMNIL